MKIDWAFAGQFVVCWIILGLVLSPYIGRALRRRRIEQTRKHFREVKQAVVLNRQEMERAVRADLARPFALDTDDQRSA